MYQTTLELTLIHRATAKLLFTIAFHEIIHPVTFVEILCLVLRLRFVNHFTFSMLLRVFELPHVFAAIAILQFTMTFDSVVHKITFIVALS